MPASFNELVDIESWVRAAAPSGLGAAIVLLERADAVGHAVTGHQVQGNDKV
jgi:hypothetical protein